MKKKSVKFADDVPNNQQNQSQSNNKNINFELTQKNIKIEKLNQEKKKYIKLIYGMQSELYSLKNRIVNIHKLESDLKFYQNKSSNLELELEKAKNEILDLHKKYNEDKRKIDNTYNEEIKMIKMENENLKNKIGMVNDLTKEKNSLTKAFNILLEEKNNILSQHDKNMRKNEINNQIKLNKLKKKMIDSINETQLKANELNMECMDVSTKLTLLQNHQFIVQLEYQEQQLNKLMTKNDLLEKKISELKKDIEIHKEVELSLAEKNKKLTEENNKLKNEEKNENEKIIEKANLIKSNSVGNLGIDSIEKNNINSNRIIHLEKKVIDLEKQLQTKQREYIDIKDKSDSFEKIMKNYEKKYMGLFNYFDECLKLFFNDEELKNNKDINLNIDLMKKGDFSNLNKNEKYSILIILMKYLMPLIYNNEILNNFSPLNNINFKYYSNNRKLRITNGNKDFNTINTNNIKNILNRKVSHIRKNESSLSPNLKYNSFDDFPDIHRNSSLISPRKFLSINSKKL